MAIILMDDVFTMKFGQNVQNKILFTYLQTCLANCLEVIKEKPGGGGGAESASLACLGLMVFKTALRLAK